MEDTIRIPRERIGAVIGKNGQTKKDLEHSNKVKLKVDSQSGEVGVKGNTQNPIGFYNSLNIIKAIARGFSAEHAFLLNQENYSLEIIDIKEELNATEKELEQKKGRIIGTAGKTRSEIEAKTDCFIAVYGKTVSIIGETEHMDDAKKAIEMLLSGASHSRVYGYLNNTRKPQTFEL